MPWVAILGDKGHARFERNARYSFFPSCMDFRHDALEGKPPHSQSLACDSRQQPLNGSIKIPLVTASRIRRIVSRSCTVLCYGIMSVTRAVSYTHLTLPTKRIV